MSSRRTDHYLHEAVRLCGREVAPRRYQLHLSQRAIASKLGISISTFRHHLNEAGSRVESVSPLVVQLGYDLPDSDQQPASHPETVQRGSSTIPADLVSQLLRNAAQLQETARELVELASSLLQPSVREQSREKLDHRAAPRATFVASQSESFETKELTDCPSTSIASREEATARPTADVARSLRPVAISDQQLDAVLEPLIEQCRRLHLPGVDRDGRRLLQQYSEGHLRDGVRHVLKLLPTRSVQKPCGLLIAMLERNQIPATPPPLTSVPAAQETEKPCNVERCAPVDAMDDEACRTFWNTRVRPALPQILASRERGIRSMRTDIANYLHDHPNTTAPLRSCHDIS